jgi:hypothetical protein
MWKCPGCGEAIEDQFDQCWHCDRPKPENPVAVDTPPQSADNFEETPQDDGTIAVKAYGHDLTCPVCQGQRFHERSSLLNTKMMTFFKLDWANKEATNFICAQCGYIFWFLLQ